MAGLPWNPNPSPLDAFLNKKNNENLKKATNKKTTTKKSSSSTKGSSTTSTKTTNNTSSSSSNTSTNTANPPVNFYGSQAQQDTMQQNYGVTPDTPQYQNDPQNLPPPPTATDNSTNTASTQQLYEQTIQNQTIQQNPGGGVVATQIQNRPDQSGIISTQQDVQRRRNQEMREQKQYLAGYNPTTGEPIIVNEATTQSRYNYNPQDPDYIRERQIINDSTTELQDAQKLVNTAMEDMPGLIQQSRYLSDLPEGTSLFIDNNQNNIFDEGIDTKISREEALQDINQIITNRQQIISQGPQISQGIKDLENNRNIIDTMQRLGYEMQRDEDGSIVFTEPDSKTVYDATYGSNPLEYAKLSLLASPLGIQTAGAILQSTVTGDKSSLDSEMQRLAKYGLDFRNNMEIDGAKAAALQGLISPAAVQGVYIPLATMGIGKGVEMMMHGAKTLLPTGTKILSKFGDDGANILQGLFQGTKTMTAPLRYAATKLGTTRLGNMALAGGLYGAMEGPRMMDILSERPEDLGGELASSLFTYGLSTAAVMSGRPKISPQERQLQNQMIDDGYKSMFKTNPFKRYDFRYNIDTGQMTGEKYVDLFGKRLVYNRKELTSFRPMANFDDLPKWNSLGEPITRQPSGLAQSNVWLPSKTDSMITVGKFGDKLYFSPADSKSWQLKTGIVPDGIYKNTQPVLRTIWPKPMNTIKPGPLTIYEQPLRWDAYLESGNPLFVDKPSVKLRLKEKTKIFTLKDIIKKDKTPLDLKGTGQTTQDGQILLTKPPETKTQQMQLQKQMQKQQTVQLQKQMQQSMKIQAQQQLQMQKSIYKTLLQQDSMMKIQPAQSNMSLLGLLSMQSLDNKQDTKKLSIQALKKDMLSLNKSMSALDLGSLSISATASKSMSLSDTMKDYRMMLKTVDVKLPDIVNIDIPIETKIKTPTPDTTIPPPYKFDIPPPPEDDFKKDLKKYNTPLKFNITDFTLGEWKVSNIEDGFNTENINKEIQKLMKGMKL